jgi:hypothetical protein
MNRLQRVSRVEAAIRINWIPVYTGMTKKGGYGLSAS